MDILRRIERTKRFVLSEFILKSARTRPVQNLEGMGFPNLNLNLRPHALQTSLSCKFQGTETSTASSRMEAPSDSSNGWGHLPIVPMDGTSFERAGKTSFESSNRGRSLLNAPRETSSASSRMETSSESFNGGRCPLTVPREISSERSNGRRASLIVPRETSTASSRRPLPIVPKDGDLF